MKEASKGFDEKEEPIQWVTLRTFQIEAEAALLAAQLESSGIPTFLADSFTASAFPMGEGGFRLQVPKISFSHAQAIQFEFEKSFKENVETNFREATQEDIAYQKELNKGNNQNYSWVWTLLFIGIALLLLRVIGRSLGILPDWLDPF